MIEICERVCVSHLLWQMQRHGSLAMVSPCCSSSRQITHSPASLANTSSKVQTQTHTRTHTHKAGHVSVCATDSNISDSNSITNRAGCSQASRLVHYTECSAYVRAHTAFTAIQYKLLQCLQWSHLSTRQLISLVTFL